MSTAASGDTSDKVGVAGVEQQGMLHVGPLHSDCVITWHNDNTSTSINCIPLLPHGTHTHTHTHTHAQPFFQVNLGKLVPPPYIIFNIIPSHRVFRHDGSEGTGVDGKYIIPRGV